MYAFIEFRKGSKIFAKYFISRCEKTIYKKVLQRLDLNKCIQNIKFDELVDVERAFGLSETITPEMYISFKEYICELKKWDSDVIKEIA